MITIKDGSIYKTYKILPDEYPKIISLYNDGYSSNDIAKLYDVNGQTILNILSKTNTTRKDHNGGFYDSKRKKNKFDLNFFNIESKELAYFMGFVLGDGSLSIDNKIHSYKLTITQHVKDIDRLFLFCDWLHLDRRAIKYSNTVKRADICIFDKFFKENILKKWGIVERKTYNPVIPNITSDELFKYFLIGLIDADGHISQKRGRYVCEIVGNYEIIKWINQELINRGFTGNSVLRKKDKYVWGKFCIYQKDNLIKLANFLNISDCEFLMKRKWSNLQNIIVNNKENIIYI